MRRLARLAFPSSPGAVVVLGAVALAALLGGGCGTVPADDRIGVLAPNGSEEAFGPVGDLLTHRCGSLDCHGRPERNLRIFGCEGRRISSTDASICSRAQGGKKTTAAEHEATYRSLVGLEPTVMSRVVAERGIDPSLLTFVRKARGTEAHIGGVLIVPGDDQDLCITSWLGGQTDLTACSGALAFPNFPPVGPQP